MLRFRSLGSGSTGNATLVEATQRRPHVTRLLVDCGFALRQLDARLARAGLLAERHRRDLHHARARRPHRLRACAVAARAHSGLDERRHLARRPAGTTSKAACSSRATASTSRSATSLVQPFTVPHDAREPLQLRCSDGARRLGVLTDLGHATPHVLARLSGSTPCCSSATTTATCWRARPTRPSSSSAWAATTATCRTRPPRRSRGPCSTRGLRHVLARAPERAEQPARARAPRAGRGAGCERARDAHGRCAPNGSGLARPA